MNKRRFARSFILILVLLCALTGPAAAGDHPGAAGRVVVFLVEGVRLDEMLGAGLNHFKAAASQGAAGMMTLRVTGSFLAEKTLLTISAGSQTPAGPESGVGAEPGEEFEGRRAGDVYFVRTGHRAPDRGAVALEMASLLKRAAPNGTAGQPGVIGSSLRRGGLKTAVIGNSDTADSIRRPGILLAMDDRGLVDSGAVGANLLVPAPGFPAGRRLNEGRLIEGFDRAIRDCSLIVVDDGDLARVESEGECLTASAAAGHRKYALQQADSILGRIMDRLDRRRDLLMLICTAPSGMDVKAGQRLTPVVAFGRGISPGVLVTPTTRTPGLVAPEDVTATIISSLGVKPVVPLGGQVFDTAPGDVNSLASSAQRWLADEQIRVPLLVGFVSALVLLVLAALFVALFPPGRPRVSRTIRVLLVWVSAVPLAYLYLPLFGAMGPIRAGVTAGALAVVAAWAAVTLSGKRPLDAFAWVAVATVVSSVCDVFTGAHLLHHSPFSYSPMVGARFYGIGNEYMGLLVGASIMAGAALLDRFSGARAARWSVFAVFALITAFVALPGLGANVGGAITAVLGFAAMAFLVRGRRFGLREIALALGGVVLVLALLIVNELSRSSSQMTHLGRAYMGIVQDGPSGFLVLLQRKINMNLRLFRYTFLTWVLVGGLLVLPFILNRPPQVLVRGFAHHPMARKGVIGCVVASLVALVVNDSGIVAAGTCIAFAGMVFLCTAMGEGELHASPAGSYSARRRPARAGRFESR